MKKNYIKIVFLLFLPFAFFGCTHYQSLTELKTKIKPSELETTVVEAKFAKVKRNILANAPRCFSTIYNVSGDCKVHTNTSRKLELTCSRKMNDSYLGSSKTTVLLPYIKAEKVDKTHTEITVYSGYHSIINTIVVEWATDVHQMCPSIL
jgi:hypothetical protein